MSEQHLDQSDVKMGKGKKHDGGFWETVVIIAQALAIALVIRIFIFQPFQVPTGSLEPTVLPGDYLIATQYPYGYSRYSLPIPNDLFSGRIFGTQPKRGDIVVFKFPGNDSINYVKRLIGLPGDKIQLKNARLYINGEEVAREPTTPIKTTNAFGTVEEVPTYYETLPGGVRHLIIQVKGDGGEYSNTGVYEVPPDHYFMMGDNRDNSSDSRVSPEVGGVGYVPFENLMARGELIFFSLKHGYEPWQLWYWPWSVRWDRLFQRIH